MLKPTGRYYFSVWDKIAENEFGDVVTQAVGEMFPRDPPLFLARTPHGHHDIDTLRAHLNAAGFSEVSVDAVDERSKALSPREAAIAYVEGTPLRNEVKARDASRLEGADFRRAVSASFQERPFRGGFRPRADMRSSKAHRVRKDRSPVVAGFGRLTQLGGCSAVTALESPIEVREVTETGLKCNSRDAEFRPPIVAQHSMRT